MQPLVISAGRSPTPSADDYFWGRGRYCVALPDDRRADHVLRAAHGADPGSIRTLFSVLNNGDTAKIALLAVMIGISSLLARRSEQLPGWLTLGGLIFAPVLAISGLAFPLNSDALYALLEVTLLLLLTWAIATAVVVSRRVPTEDVRARGATASPAHWTDTLAGARSGGRRLTPHGFPVRASARQEPSLNIVLPMLQKIGLSALVGIVYKV
jgi:hypothetical protein